jgi:phosphoribosylformylglycinamidine synthase
MIEAISKMAFGNNIGFRFNSKLTINDIKEMLYGNIIVEVREKIKDLKVIGKTIKETSLIYNREEISLKDAYDYYSKPLEKVFPTSIKAPTSNARIKDCNLKSKLKPNKYVNKPLVVIPIFPGTNCEYDSKSAFEKAGAKVHLIIFKNKTKKDIEESINELEVWFKKANIIMIPGGFSAGDEPEGSGNL